MRFSCGESVSIIKIRNYDRESRYTRQKKVNFVMKIFFTMMSHTICLLPTTFVKKDVRKKLTRALFFCHKTLSLSEQLLSVMSC